MKQRRRITGEKIVVRKSSFVGTLVRVDDGGEARKIVKKLKNADRKAAHVAFAFRIGDDPVEEGMSDDGEPRGTAGLPILMLLRHDDRRNVLVAVTRYWGGVKLGTGNLRRAYAEAAKSVLASGGKKL